MPAARHQTRRRFGGRHPLCGIGVTSLIEITPSPVACKARTADSRPPPGPLTYTITAAHPEFGAFARSSFSRHLCGERRTFARSLEADRTGARPRHHQPLRIGNRHDRVVESRMHMSDAFRARRAAYAVARGGVLRRQRRRAVAARSSRAPRGGSSPVAARALVFFGLVCHQPLIFSSIPVAIRRWVEVLFAISTAPSFITSAGLASSRRPTCAGPSECGHWYASAGPVPAIRGDDACRDNNPNPSDA